MGDVALRRQVQVERGVQGKSLQLGDRSWLDPRRLQLTAHGAGVPSHSLSGKSEMLPHRQCWGRTWGTQVTVARDGEGAAGGGSE